MDEHDAHWSAIELMGENAQALAQQLRDIPLCPFGLLVGRLSRAGTTLLDVTDFMQNVEPLVAGLKLPASWDVTSDSIACRAAIALGAPELVLLKSIDRPGNVNLAQLSREGLVDAFLPRCASELSAVTLINFRAEPFTRRPS
jgi:aspartokinase-like uncharacterized kinase